MWRSRQPCVSTTAVAVRWLVSSPKTAVRLFASSSPSSSSSPLFDDDSNRRRRPIIQPYHTEPQSSVTCLRPASLLFSFPSSRNKNDRIFRMAPPMRYFGSSSSDSSSSNNNNMEGETTAVDVSSVDETLNRLFSDDASTALLENSATAAASDAWYTVADTATAWSPVWYNCADQAIVAITQMHELTHLSYGWSIVATTMALRIVLFPLLIQAQQTTSRMAHVQPELTILKLRYEKLGSPTRAEQVQFSNNMKALFAKYKVNPFKAMIAPMVQLPVFVGMFFGLKKMPELFPSALSDGGMFWFVDLTVPDPLYILPAVSAVTFLALIEMGKEQMLVASPGQQGMIMLNMFRLMALVSLPFIASFESAMLCYWSTNNILTMAQTALLKAKPVRRYFDIWDPPKPVPGTENNGTATGLVESVTNLVKTVQGQAVTEAQKIKQHNQEIEAKRTTFRLTQAAKERRRKNTGITGTRNM